MASLTTAQEVRIACAAAALAVVACGLPGGAISQPPPGTPATPAIFLPPEWTATPAPPTPDVPADWEEFSAGRLHLWLPESFEGGDVEAMLPQVVETLRNLGTDYAEMADYLEQNPGIFALWLVDSVRGPSGAISNVNVTREDVPETVSLQEYLDVSADLMPPNLEILEQGIVTLGERELGKFVLSGKSDTVRRMVVLYTVRDGPRFWNVTYATDPAEFVDRTPIWERSIRSLRLGD